MILGISKPKSCVLIVQQVRNDVLPFPYGLASRDVECHQIEWLVHANGPTEDEFLSHECQLIDMVHVLSGNKKYISIP